MHCFTVELPQVVSAHCLELQSLCKEHDAPTSEPLAWTSATRVRIKVSCVLLRIGRHKRCTSTLYLEACVAIVRVTVGAEGLDCGLTLAWLISCQPVLCSI